MKTKTRFVVAIVSAAINFSIIGWIHRHTSSSFLTISDPYSCRVTGKNWIVTTVKSLSPKTIRNILKTADWKLLVIGEKVTPQNWSDQFSSRTLLYLSFQEQTSLDLHLVRYISDSINCQKNIGYIVAIFCGAKVIYELDDNSIIWGPEIQVYPSVQSAVDIPWLAFRLKRSPFVNMYTIFGQPELWPRGIPINELQNISEDGWSSLRRNDNETINPYIQQKLFDFDPDVDAMTRLTRPVLVKRTVFDRDRRPIALEPFTFSPYNSQNTIHHHASFWGLYLPVTLNSQVADIWRGFWVQRLLWDIGGHLVFATSTVRRRDRLKATIKDLKNEQSINIQAGKFVRYLSSWKPATTTLAATIQELIDALVKVELLHKLESTIIRAWLLDLSRIKYKFPLFYQSAENIPHATRIKRAAICVTGLAECVEEIWAKNEMELRKRLIGDIDVFLFLSAGDGIVNDISPTVFNVRIKKTRFYNSTVNIVHRDILNINPGFSPTCKYQYKYTQKHKIEPIEQERFAQASCFNIVREYEKKRKVKYQLLIRARTDTAFARLPKSFERNGEFNLNNTIIVPNEHHYFGVNDRFAIGSIDLMEHYMYRWYQLSLCLTENIHPESFLAFVLRKSGIRVTTDNEISLVQIPHSEKQCH